jgi:hypothetical protein
MTHPLLRASLLLVWLVFGLGLILIPWSGLWEANYFLFQYPALGTVMKSPFVRGAVSGLGFMNVLMSLEAFRRRPAVAANRT